MEFTADTCILVSGWNNIMFHKTPPLESGRLTPVSFLLLYSSVPTGLVSIIGYFDNGRKPKSQLNFKNLLVDSENYWLCVLTSGYNVLSKIGVNKGVKVILTAVATTAVVRPMVRPPTVTLQLYCRWVVFLEAPCDWLQYIFKTQYHTQFLTKL